ncbi:hypothetical protein Hypma_006586 [Hypsizygus marmoreus]|uniref:Uncharacterized protein n=1 Tax=Hypsizygus marmoreus TaxID=39966 RepID=A0A369K0L0_HYPMA|nr:hypothetical protein Hypma_006586 [Hypsizygus marmoreus]
MDKCLADIKAFSEREHRPFEETRQYVAEWHSKYLFQPQSISGTSSAADAGLGSKVRSVLYDASRILESLCEVTGVQSFLLAVDPLNPSDMGFLGGSVAGREFWRGMRNGGEAGAKSFKHYCLRDMESSQPASTINREEGPSSRASSLPAKTTPAKSIKTELYENVRKALRSASGIRNAEMKWTNPERLDAYGVRLVGWPSSVPAQNPSTLKTHHNKLLLECLQNGTMRFERLHPTPGEDNYNVDEGNVVDELGEVDDFSWAYDADGGDSVSGNVVQDHVLLQAPEPYQSNPHMQYLLPHQSNGNLRCKNLPSPPTMTSSRKRPRSGSPGAQDDLR